MESERTRANREREDSSQVNKFVEVLVSRQPDYGRHSKYAEQMDGGWALKRSDNRNRV